MFLVHSSMTRKQQHGFGACAGLFALLLMPCSASICIPLLAWAVQPDPLDHAALAAQQKQAASSQEEEGSEDAFSS